VRDTMIAGIVLANRWYVGDPEHSTFQGFAAHSD
jgi:hypothetical protein